MFCNQTTKPGKIVLGAHAGIVAAKKGPLTDISVLGRIDFVKEDGKVYKNK